MVTCQDVIVTLDGTGKGVLTFNQSYVLDQDTCGAVVCCLSILLLIDILKTVAMRANPVVDFLHMYYNIDIRSLDGL